MSKYVGVTWSKRNMKWRAAIKRQGKFHYLGEYEDEEKAVKAYRAGLKKWPPLPHWRQR